VRRNKSGAQRNMSVAQHRTMRHEINT